MTAFSLLAVTFIMHVVMVIWFVSCVSLVLIVLIQKGRGGGLSATFGGGGAGGVLGSKTGDFLTWLTIALVGLFLVLSVVMAKFYRPSITDFGAVAPVQQQQPQEQPPIPAATDQSNTATDANAPGN